MAGKRLTGHDTRGMRCDATASTGGCQRDRGIHSVLPVCQFLVPFSQKHVTPFRTQTGCAHALLLFPHPQASWLTETQGNSLPHLYKAIKVLNCPARQRFHRQTFPHTPVKLVSPPCLGFGAPLGGRFRQMAPKRTRRLKGNVHVAAQPKQCRYFV
jgi:hypothetical protein